MKEITLQEFNLLTFIEKNNKHKYSQREMAKAIAVSLGSLNKIYHKLLEEEWIVEQEDRIQITALGLKKLEPYRVKRAIFMAAGFGTRLVPITVHTPKPLIQINEMRIIDTLIDAVLEAGIEEIYIVRGYLKEKFDILLEKYPQIHFIDNPYDQESENVGSVYVARKFLENSYVLESDIILYNKKLIRKYEYESNYLAFYQEKTDDWCFQTQKGIIQSLSQGGENCYQMCGISYFDLNDGKQLAKDLEYVFEQYPGGKERYFDQVHLDICKKNYQIHIRECNKEDYREIDTIKELEAVIEENKR